MNLGAVIKSCKNGEDCAQGADVIVTATSSKVNLVQDDWIKEGAHVNGTDFEFQSRLRKKVSFRRHLNGTRPKKRNDRSGANDRRRADLNASMLKNRAIFQSSMSKITPV